MKLTKLQRYTAYCILLVDAKNYLVYTKKREFLGLGLCFAVNEIFNIDNNGFFKNSDHGSGSIHRVLSFFPELNKDYRADKWGCLFEKRKQDKQIAIKQRINSIKQAIKETHPDL